MSINQTVCTEFKKELLLGTHDFSTDVFKIALYTSDADLGEDTTVYSATNEVAGTGYSAGGATLTAVTPATSGAIAYVDFADVEWTSSTITARGALIYNSDKSNKAVSVLDFGTDKTTSASTFSIQFPTADAVNAIIRIG